LKVCLEYAHTQAARAAQIVKNLRNFVSKSEGMFCEVSLNTLVRDAVDLVAIEARRRWAQVELALVEPDTTIQVNPVQIQQVLVNLLINAFEAVEVLPESDRHLCVVTSIGVDHVGLAVMDSGPGIDEDDLTRVFEPFFTTKSYGMGMGLAVSRTIVITHGGKIWAERNARGGTTFRVTLPHETTATLPSGQQP
jgi:two-component system, LuxR family, sensor kinase FixL